MRTDGENCGNENIYFGPNIVGFSYGLENIWKFSRPR